VSRHIAGRRKYGEGCTTRMTSEMDKKWTHCLSWVVPVEHGVGCQWSCSSWCLQRSRPSSPPLASSSCLLVPKMIEGLARKKVVGASAGDCHTAVWMEAGELLHLWGLLWGCCGSCRQRGLGRATTRGGQGPWGHARAHHARVIAAYMYAHALPPARVRMSYRASEMTYAS